MSSLVILGFESREQADAARDTAERLQGRGELEVRDLALAW
jgi:hypothetical protein